MLKSTYRPNDTASTAPAPPPLPEGWTEHLSPQGIPYYWNATLKKSTYTRPVVEGLGITPQAIQPIYYQPKIFPGSIPDAYGQNNFRGGYKARGGHGFQGQRRDQDRPKHKYVIPGCLPWVLVKTKLGRRFVHNPETKESLWRFPEHVMKGVIELDRLEREKREHRKRGEPSDVGDEGLNARVARISPSGDVDLEDSDRGDEFEVTDNEAEVEEMEVEEEGEDDEDVEEDEDTSAPKKRKTETEGPIEFHEDDIAWQLQAIGEYGEEPGTYDTTGDEPWEDGSGGLGDDDYNALFWDMLEDHHINPYTPWDTIMENDSILSDDRYTVFTNMKARKEAWSVWSTEKIQALRELREKQEKQDPNISYMAFLQSKATPKLYWPEFKRKYRKEPEMKDTKISDKDKERWYREHISRLKLPQSTAKADLTALLKSLPLSALNRSTTLATLPSTLLADIRYITLPPSVRDALIEMWVSTLQPAPEGTEMTEEAREEASRKLRERERREKALADRERRVQEDKRRQRRELAYGKDQLREEEREIERAMKVGKEGLKAQLGYSTDLSQMEAA